MITTANISMQFGSKALFEDISITFNKGNRYGLIGANGSGKSTFMKILSGELEPTEGYVKMDKNERIATLSQDQFAYEEIKIIDCVIMGHKELYDIKIERERIYALSEMSDEDGLKVADLEVEFADMDGYSAESNAGELLLGVGIPVEDHEKTMSVLAPALKLRVLLAQALFGNPEVLLLDEPTNNLDINTIRWLENSLKSSESTMIVISHDRHFLDTVCTNIVDIDFQKVQLFTGNYTFWYESSQLMISQRAAANKKAEEKKKELQSFIARFSANASKSRQATSRKKLLEKINIDEMKPSARKYPAIIFNQFREAGDQILEVKNLSAKDENGEILFEKLSFVVNKGDKICFLADNKQALTYLYQILSGEKEPLTGEFSYGQTIKHSYFPNDHDEYFKSSDNLIDWLREFSEDKDDQYVRGFLGKMLFSGEEVLKSTSVLSGGEKVRCMFSKMMLNEGNLLIFDDPTNHLDLESIQALNNSMKNFKGTILFSSHDHELNETVANRIIEITPGNTHDKLMDYKEFLEFKGIREKNLSV